MFYKHVFLYLRTWMSVTRRMRSYNRRTRCYCVPCPLSVLSDIPVMHTHTQTYTHTCREHSCFTSCQYHIYMCVSIASILLVLPIPYICLSVPPPVKFTLLYQHLILTLSRLTIHLIYKAHTQFRRYSIAHLPACHGGMSYVMSVQFISFVISRNSLVPFM